MKEKMEEEEGRFRRNSRSRILTFVLKIYN